MKQKSTKILVILIALILIVGAIMIGVKGLAFELKYQNYKNKKYTFFSHSNNRFFMFNIRICLKISVAICKYYCKYEFFVKNIEFFFIFH